MSDMPDSTPQAMTPEEFDRGEIMAALTDFKANVSSVVGQCVFDYIAHLEAERDALKAEVERKGKALRVAVNLIMGNEPGDSRAVSDIAVALAAVDLGLDDTDGKIMREIDAALTPAKETNNEGN